MAYWVIRRDGIPHLAPYLENTKMAYTDDRSKAYRFFSKLEAKDYLKRFCKHHAGSPRVVRVVRKK